MKILHFIECIQGYRQPENYTALCTKYDILIDVYICVQIK